jgi:hypothetical protein
VLMLVLAAAYLVAPVVAGVFEIGDRWGPAIYPVTLHEVLYKVGWGMATHKEDGKPRIWAGARPEWRPLFYGMYSKNDDPAVMRQELERPRSGTSGGL